EGKPAAQERSSLGALFVCQGEATQVFHVLDERKVRLVANFSTGRRVLATGAGGVLVEGGCALSVASGTRDGCLVRANGLTPVGLGKAVPKEVFALGENDAFHVSLTKKGQLRQRRLGSSEPAKLYQVPSEHEVATLIRE